MALTQDQALRASVALVVCKWVHSHSSDDIGHTLLNVQRWEAPAALQPYVVQVGLERFVAAAVLGAYAAGRELPTPVEDWL